MLRIRSHTSDDRLNLLINDRSWICAAAGWAVVAVIVLSGRGASRSADDRRGRFWPKVPAALSAGLLTAAAAGIVQFTVVAVFGYNRNRHALLVFFQTPPSLLFATMPVILPLVALIGLSFRPPIGWPEATGAAVAAVLTTATLAVALVGGLFAPVTGEPHDFSGVLADLDAVKPFPVVPPLSPPPSAPPTTTPSHLPTSIAVDPGRALDQAAANAVLSDMRKLLPAGYQTVPSPKETDTDFSGVRPKACGDQLAASRAADRSTPTLTDVDEAFTVPALGTLNGLTVTMDVSSYAGPAPGFAEQRGRDTVCGKYTVPVPAEDDGVLHNGYSEGPPPSLPFPTYRENASITGYYNSNTFVEKILTDYLQVGHNQIWVSVSYIYINEPPPPATAEYPGQLTVAALTTAIRRLQQT